MKDSKMAGIWYSVGGGICWGLSGCFGQFLFQQRDITAEWLVSVRLIFAGILLVVIGCIRDKKQILQIFNEKKDRRKFIFFSFFGMLACQYTYFAAIQHSNAGTATVLQATAPIVILIAMCFTQKRLPKGFEALAICSTLMGTFILSTHGDIGSMTISTAALFFGLTSAVTVAYYNVLGGELLRRFGVCATLGFAMLLSGSAMALVVQPWKDVIAWDIQTVLAVLGIIFVGTALAFGLFMKGVSIVGPFVGSLIGSVEPVTAIIVSAVFLGSPFVLLDVVGFAMILGTVIMLAVHNRGDGVSEEPEEPEEPAD